MSTVSAAGSNNNQIENVSMEHDGTLEPASKRVRLNPEGEVENRSTSIKAPLDEVAKKNALRYIAHTHDWLAGICLPPVDQNNIDEMAKITSKLLSIHNLLKQDATGKGGLKDKIKADDMFMGKVTNGAIKKAMREIAILYGFDYTSSDAHRRMIGVVSPFLASFAAFKNRLAEVRIQNREIILTKKGTETHVVDISHYGLSSIHAPFLEGSSYTPSTKSSMANSLGPLTITLALANTTATDFQKKWKEAFMNTFSNIPRIEEIANSIAGRKTAAKSVISLIGDLCLLGIARNSNKAFFPFAVLRKLWMIKPNAQTAHQPQTTTALDYPDSYLNLDLSGIGMIRAWNESINTAGELTMNGDKKIAHDMSECVVHATFGLYKDDLNISHALFRKNFKTRKQLGDIFKGRNTETNFSVTLPSFKKAIKLSSACQSNIFNSTPGQITRCPVTSTKYTLQIGRDHPLILALNRSINDDQRVSGQMDIIPYLVNLLRTARDKILKDGSISYGTMQMVYWDPSKTRLVDMVACEYVPSEESYYYQA